MILSLHLTIRLNAGFFVFGGYYDYTPETDGNNGIMDLKHREYEISDEVVAHQTEALMKAYGMYKYAVTEDGCENKVRLCNEAKKGIRNILSNLPEWDAEKCYARFSINWERPIVPERITEFTEWFKKELKNIYAEKNFVPCGMTRNELRESLRRVQGTIHLMSEMLSLNNITPTAYQAVTLSGFNLNYYKEEFDRLNKVKDLFYQKDYLYNRGKEIFLSKEDGILINEINTFPGETPISMFPKMLEHNGDTMVDFLAKAVRRAIAQKHK